MDSRSLVLGVGQELDTIWTASIVGGTREGDEQRPYIFSPSPSLSAGIQSHFYDIPFPSPVRASWGPGRDHKFFWGPRKDLKVSGIINPFLLICLGGEGCKMYLRKR